MFDFSLEAANDALSTKAEKHASYFLNELSEQDIQVIDEVAGLLSDGAGAWRVRLFNE